MTDNNPSYSLLAGVLARATLAASVIWCLAALFSGSRTFITHDMGLVWIINTTLFVVNVFLLKKDRNMLVLVIANLVGAIILTSIVYGFLSNDGPVIGIMMGLCAMVGVVSHLYWINNGFSDRELTNQMQFLIMSATLQMLTAGLLQKEALWAGETIGMIVFVLICTVLSKHSGIRGQEKAGGISLKSAAACLAVVCLLVVIMTAAKVSAEPAAGIMNYITEGMGIAVNMILTAIGYIYIFLSSIFTSAKLSDYEAGGGSSGQENVYFGEATGNIDFVKILFCILLTAFVVVMLIVIFDYLRSLFVGKRVKKRSLAPSVVTKESFLVRLRNLIQKIKKDLKIRLLLLKNPASMAAVMIKMEKMCRKKALLRKKEGETAREFIGRLSDHADDETTILLRAFADQFDAAFYSREKNYLKEFPQYKKMLKTLKNSLTTRV